jgi:hypothetical protein
MASKCSLFNTSIHILKYRTVKRTVAFNKKSSPNCLRRLFCCHALIYEYVGLPLMAVSADVSIVLPSYVHRSVTRERREQKIGPELRI